MLATDIVKASSLWSTVNVSDVANELETIDGPVMIQHAVADEYVAWANSEQLAQELEAIGHPFEFHSYAGDDHFFEGVDLELAADRDAAFFRAAMH